MNRTLSTMMLTLAVALSSVTSTHSQTRRDSPRQRLREERADRVRSVSLMFIHRLRETLELSDEQVLKLLPLLEQIEAERAASHERRETIAQRVRLLARDEEATDDDVAKVIRDLDAEEERARAMQNDKRDQMLALLEPYQKARFILAANQLRRRMEQQLRRMEQDRSDRRPGWDRDDGR